MTPLRISIVASIASFLLILVVLELIRSRRLRSFCEFQSIPGTAEDHDCNTAGRIEHDAISGGQRLDRHCHQRLQLCLEPGLICHRPAGEILDLQDDHAREHGRGRGLIHFGGGCRHGVILTAFAASQAQPSRSRCRRVLYLYK